MLDTIPNASHLGPDNNSILEMKSEAQRVTIMIKQLESGGIESQLKAACLCGSHVISILYVFYNQEKLLTSNEKILLLQ